MQSLHTTLSPNPVGPSLSPSCKNKDLSPTLVSPLPDWSTTLLAFSSL